MRFKAFLNESKRINSPYKPISEKQLYTLMRTRFSEAFNEKNPYIVRGMEKINNKDNMLLVSGISGRVSANTTNEYTVLIDNSPAWKDYPKRSESLICTTIGNIEYAQDFGYVFMILPENGAKIGVCQSFDFWESFPVVSRLLKQSKITEHLTSIDNLNYLLRELMDIAGIELSEDNTSYETLVVALNKLTTYIRNENSPHIAAEEKMFFKTVISGKESMIGFCQRLLDPLTNRFKLLNYKDLKTISSRKKEVWISAPSLAITIPNESNPDIYDFYTYFNKLKSNINET